MKSLFSCFRTAASKHDQQGYQVVSVGRDGLKYVEGDHELLAQAELQSGKPDRVIYASTVRKWRAPYDQETISPEKQKEIICRLEAYYTRQNVTCEVV
jgi:hypothetical protein